MQINIKGQQSCCLMGAQSPDMPMICSQATKSLNKECVWAPKFPAYSVLWNCSNKLSLETHESSWGKEIYTQKKGDMSFNVSWTLTVLLSRLIGMFLLHFSLVTNIFHLCWMLSLVIVCIVIKAKKCSFQKNRVLKWSHKN